MDKHILLSLKENITTELKVAEQKIPQNVYETICAFANTIGGDIYLGIKENKEATNEIVGISSFDVYKTSIVNTIHNKNKFSYPIVKDIDITKIEIDDKVILKIHVDEAPLSLKPIYLNESINQSYGRDNDGDYILSMDQIRYLLSNNNVNSDDQLPNIYGLSIENINNETLRKYRNELNIVYPNNIYSSLDNEAFLKKIGALIKTNTGDWVLTNAAVLMFTSYDDIIKIYPSYFLDYISNVSSTTKWDNRIVVDEPTWSGNVFDFYYNVINDLFKNIPSSYYSEKGKNIGSALMRDAIKEALCNAISNHSFFLNIPLKITRNINQIIFRNSGKMLVPIEQALIGGISKPRNKGIITYFRRIGIADRTGSGIPQIFNALKLNSYIEPKIIEDTIPEDNTTLLISFIPSVNESTQNTTKILDYLTNKGKNGASIDEIRDALKLSRTTVSTICNSLLLTNQIIDNGKKTKGKIYYISIYKDIN